MKKAFSITKDAFVINGKSYSLENHDICFTEGHITVYNFETGEFVLKEAFDLCNIHLSSYDKKED